MIIEPGMIGERNLFTRSLMEFKLDVADRAGIALDVTEAVATRMRNSSDMAVLNIAIFVQKTLDLFVKTGGRYAETLDTLIRLSQAAAKGERALFHYLSLDVDLG